MRLQSLPGKVNVLIVVNVTWNRAGARKKVDTQTYIYMCCNFMGTRTVSINFQLSFFSCLVLGCGPCLPGLGSSLQEPARNIKVVQLHCVTSQINPCESMEEFHHTKQHCSNPTHLPVYFPGTSCA